MEKLSIALTATILWGCYAADNIDGDAALCREECYDSDPCTEDFCDIDDNCHHVPIPGCGAECASDLDCDDGINCTVDYCDADHVCGHFDECEDPPPPVCDPMIHPINIFEAIGNLDAASDGELIMLVMSGEGAACNGRIDLLDPLNPPTDMPASRRIEEDAQVLRPFVFWSEGETPRLFWTKISDVNSVVTARFDVAAGGVVDKTALIEHGVLEPQLNDVARIPSGEYGLAWQMTSSDEYPISFFHRYTADLELAESFQILPTYNHLPVVAALEDGWSVAVTGRDESGDLGTVYYSEYRPPSSPTMRQLAVDATVFATRAVVNTSSAKIVLYDRYVTEEIKQLFAGWVNDEGNVLSIDLAWQTKGLDSLSSYDLDSALISWCAIDLATGASSVRAVRFTSTSLLETVFWSQGDAGCSRTKLVQVDDEEHLLWLSDSGDTLFHKNLSCY